MSMSGSKNPNKPADISELQESFSEQQKKISILKELVRKSETSNTKATSAAQEKVKNIAQRLSLLKKKTKVKRSADDLTKVENSEETIKNEVPQSMEDSNVEPANILSQVNISSFETSPLNPESRSTSQSSINQSSGSDKVILLKQQMEQNRALLARRASSKQHLEQLVGRLKEQLDTTQQNLDTAAEMGRSMNDLSVLNVSAPREHFKSTNDLIGQQPFNLEKERLKFFENRCRLLEKQLEKEKKLNSSQCTEIEKDSVQSDLSEKVKELESELRNLGIQKENREKSLTEENERLRMEMEKSTSPLNISKSDNNRLNFDLEEENQRLTNENKEFLKRLNDLEQHNIVLEAEKCCLKEKNTQLEVKLEEMQRELNEIQKQMAETEEDLKQTKAQVNEVMEINETVNKTVKTEENVTAEMAKQIQQMQDEISELNQSNQKLKDDLKESSKIEVSEESVLEKISKLEDTIKDMEMTIKSQEETIKSQEEEIMEKSIELNVLNANFKVLEEKLEESSKRTLIFTSDSENGSKAAQLEEEVHQLKQKLDETNKVNIKLKLKCKKAEKEIENIVKVEKEKELLQQKILVLEEEKGQWQLSQVDELTTNDFNKLKDFELKYEDSLNTISKLNKENELLLEQLNVMEKEKKTLELPIRYESSDRVKSEICDAQIEEELQQTKMKLNCLQKDFEEKLKELDSYKVALEKLEAGKVDIEKKLESYIHENIELLNKIEKLSKSSSSAESIEIVERLTQQEHLELEKEYSKNLQLSQIPERSTSVGINELTQTDISPELNESLTKLRDESAELMNKIELFTSERREVLDKMERITNENKTLQEKLDHVTEQKDNLEKDYISLETDKIKLESHLNDLIKEKQILSTQIQDSIANKAQLDQELSTLRQLREVMPSIDPEESASLLDNCEKSLNRLHHELESYRKVNDKNSKFNISKKLAKEAKNAHTQFTQLLNKVREASTAIETVTVFETVVAVTAANGEDLAKYEELSQQNQLNAADIGELKAQLSKFEKECLELRGVADDLTRQLEESRLENNSKEMNIESLNNELRSLKTMSEHFEKLSIDQHKSHSEKIEHLTVVKKELEAKCDTYKGEMEILQSLIAEQKEQLIETYKEHELEIDSKLTELQERNDIIIRLQEEISDIKKSSEQAINKCNENLSKEYDDLCESMKANKVVIAEQIAELQSKQETIDVLNQQIIDLYKTMEENANKIIEKEDEVMTLQSSIDKNNEDITILQKENEDQKAVVDKLLIELHSNQYSPINNQEVAQLQVEIQNLKSNNEVMNKAKEKLESNNRELLEKLKKYAANLKKRTNQCNELETKLKEFTTNPTDSNILQEENDNLMEKLEAKVDELQTALEAKTSQHLNLMESRQSLDKELTTVKTDLDVITIEKEHILREVDLLKERLLKSEEQCAVYCTDLKSLQDTLSQTKDNMQKLEENYKQQEVNILNLESIKVDLENTIAEKKIRNSDNLLTIQKEKEALLKEIGNLKEELKNKSLKFDKCKAIIKERTIKNQSLQNTIKTLEEKIALINEDNKENESTSLKNVDTSPYNKEQYDKLEADFVELSNRYKLEKSSFENTITRLNSLHDGIQAKLQEDMAYIEKLEQENEELRNDVTNFDSLLADFKSKSIENENLKTQLEKFQHLQNDLNQKNFENENLKEELSKLRDLEEKLNFKSLENENLHKNLTSFKVLEEQLSAISFENENLKVEINKLNDLEDRLKDKSNEISLLNEKVSILSELQNQLEMKSWEIANLNDQLQNFNDLKHKFDVQSDENASLKQEIASLSEVKTQLTTMVTENQTLKEELSTLSEIRIQLSTAINEKQRLQEELYSLSEIRNKLISLTNENENLKLTINGLEKVLEEKSIVLETLEQTLNYNLQQISDERLRFEEELNQTNSIISLKENDLLSLRENMQTMEQAKLELEEQLHSYSQDQIELQELRLRSLQEQKEIESLRLQLDNTVANYETEMQSLRTQIAEMDTLRMQVGQNQTDDQVFLEFENKRLTDLLAEKEALIENYQRQNVQLQMMNSQVSQHEVAFTEERNVLLQELKEKTDTIKKLREEIGVLQEGGNRMPRAPTNEESIPPPVFFSSDNTTASLFDEIIPQRQEVNFFVNSTTLPSPSPPPPAPAQQQPSIIEDLQKNVSDLEKYAKDLENRLTLHLQREKDFEHTLQDLQMKLKLSENLVKDSESKIQALEINWHTSEEQHKQAQTNAKFLEGELQHYQQLLSHSEQKEKSLQEQLNNIKSNVKSQLDRPVDKPETGAAESRLTDAQESSLNIFFGMPSTTSEFDNLFSPQTHQPFVEEVIKPSNFYICHDDEVAIVEESPITKEASSFTMEPNHQLETLEKEIQNLKQALDLSNHQKEELNTKTHKLMKKLKEFKQKNDELSKSSITPTSRDRNSFFDGLDAAIEDELKSQIKKLEIKVKDQDKAMEDQGLEKTKLLKRIDLLEAGNERMTEMKERQDMEVQMYQARIQELQAKLNNLEDWGNDSDLSNKSLKAPCPTQSSDYDKEREEYMEREIQDINAKIEELTIENENLKYQLQEQDSKRTKDVEDVQKMDMQTSAFKELQQRYEQIEAKFNTLTLENEQLTNHNLELNRSDESLKSQISELKRQLESIGVEKLELENSILVLNDKIHNLELENQHLTVEKSSQSSDAEQFATRVAEIEENFALEKLLSQKRIKELEESLESVRSDRNDSSNNIELLAQLQEKESEIIHLKQRIEDLMREDQTEKLVLEILTKNQEIHLLKLKVKHLEDDKVELEQKIISLNSTTMTETKSYENQHQSLLEKNKSLESEIHKLLEEKAQMEEELEVLNQHVLKNLEGEDKLNSLILELDTKNIEIAELRRSLEGKANSQFDISDVNAKWEKIVEGRCQEIAQIWQQHLQQKEQEFKIAENYLRNEIDILKKTLSTSSKSASQETDNEEHESIINVKETVMDIEGSRSNAETESSSTTIEKMQAALESQEVEIVTLKEQLAIRSAEYARLAAQYDPFKLQNTLSHSNSNVVSLQDSPSSKARVETVPKPELDLAIYMLHQRDMRLEEMTLELVNLLEERDTLQLKLSDTLRKLEDVKTHTNLDDLDEATSKSLPPLQLEDLMSGPSNNDELSEKLSQLQSVNHSKDKVIKEEREQRSRQMERIQQDVAKIPPAAIYEIVGSNAADSGQSPSSILFNWLWGSKNNDNSPNS